MLFAGLLFLFITVSNTTAAIRCVNISASGAGNGNGWANAFAGTSLQAVIDMSVPGDEVWVASGTYLTSIGNNRNIYFSMRNGVAIYGSFNGTETTLSQRIFSCGFSSVLSGAIGLAGNADNSYHVISNASLNNTAVLDGFTIRDGTGNFDVLGNDSRSLGGGMLNNAANGGTSSPTIRNCLFTNNTAVFGGGIFDHGQNTGNASPVIINCIFAFNTATGGGGAIDNFGYNGNASPSINNSLFYNNTATDRAGAIYCWGGGNGNASPQILNSVFVNNSSVDGGALVSDRTNFATGNSGNANPVVRNSIFWNNTATGSGPQFYLLGGASFTATYSNINLTGQNAPHVITGPGTGNVISDPLLYNIANAVGPDNCWLTNDDGLQLLNGASPCFNSGDNNGVSAYDIRGNNRIIYSIVDMGAYEYNAGIVPVEMLQFYGRAMLYKNTISWVTGAETGHNKFELERSTDGIHFITLARVFEPQSTIGLTRHYQVNDNDLHQSKYYYRLKQFDLNGVYDYSRVILLENKDHQKNIFLSPNPVLQQSTLIFENRVIEKQSFTLLNSKGQAVKQLWLNSSNNIIDLSGEEAGLYVLRNEKTGVGLKVIKL